METLYRFTDDGITGLGREQFGVLIPLAVAVAFAVAAFITYRRRPNRYEQRGIAVVSTIFALAIAAFIGTRTYEQYTIAQAYNAKQFETLNGCVRNVSEVVYDHNVGVDTFYVSGQRLTINGSGWVRGYHQTLNQGGPLRNGAHVQILVARGKIIQIARLPGSCG